MNELLTIGEFAKLRDVTTETLRHYDRVGLLKPVKIDKYNNRRYYSITQYEKLGTIRELRQLGMNIEEIKEYFDERNIDKSYEMLKNKYEELKLHIENLQRIEESISKKLKFIEEVNSHIKLNEVTIKEIENRTILMSKTKLNNRLYEGYEISNLEKQISGVSPIIATDKIGCMLESDDVYDLNPKCYIFITLDDQMENEKLQGSKKKYIDKGNYVCINYVGNHENRIKAFKIANEYIKKNDYIINGDIIHIAKVDVTITEKEEEIIYEIQIPIK